MNAKINKFLSFIRIILKKPSLINIILDSPLVAEERFKKYYPNFKALPQIDIEQLNEKIPENRRCSVKCHTGFGLFLASGL